MPVERQPISVSQLSELLGIELPRRLLAVEKRLHQWYVVTEGDDMAQTSGTFPALSNNTAIRKPKGKGGKKKGC